MTKTPDQDTQTVATSPAGPIPRQALFPTHKAGHTVNTGEQNALDQQTDDEDVGNIPPSPAGEHSDPAEAPARPREEPQKVTVKRRLEQEGRWAEIEPQRDEMMRLARKQQGMSKLDAQSWVYSELDRLYPPPVPSPGTLPGDEIAQPPPGATSQIRGLSDLPGGWPELPANASLSAEVGWVQANRLRIVTEQASGSSSVDLGHALSPAPSWAALGWLETSIRSYAKYVDVAARATASDGGESGVVRRERVALDEVRGLLDEMMDDDPDRDR